MWSSIVTYLSSLENLKGLIEIFIGLFKSKSGMGKHPRTIEDDIPELKYDERIKNIKDSLFDDLRGIDLKTNWSARKFTQLEAEVEVLNTRGRRTRKILNLLTAIRKSKDRLFLVMGDPGSGKSVALRKLCQDLLKEVKSSQKIPIYINLKEWNTDYVWTENKMPTIDEFSFFVKNNIKNRDVILSKFFDKYYDRLYENGHLFFVLDSFDEIPAVLNENENSEIIQKLSELFLKFLKGSRAQTSQGILSSRVFRKPTKEFQANTILEIRPFNEDKIIETFKKSGIYNNSLVVDLFKNRPDLVPIAKNPFYASLFLDYTENNDNNLPNNQSELFKSYLSQTLNNCSQRIEKNKLTTELVILGAAKIAYSMFKNNLGFESNINRIKADLPDQNLEQIIDILKFSKIGRVGTGDDNLFSFSHRRFHEYFAVQYIINNDISIDLTSIPKDSQWRDVCVLYTEVVDEIKAKQIGEFCWNKIREINDLENLEALHCLRFLNDAFKGRVDCLNDYIKDFSAFIVDKIKPDHNMIGVKFAVESIGLLDINNQKKSIYAAFNLNNYWISEAAFRSCRYLSNLGIDLEIKLIQYINSMSASYFLKSYKNIKFSLSLSNSLKDVKLFSQLRFVNLYIFSILGLISIILYPYSLWFIFILIPWYFIEQFQIFFKGTEAISLLEKLKITLVLSWVYVELSLLNQLYSYFFGKINYTFLLKEEAIFDNKTLTITIQNISNEAYLCTLILLAILIPFITFSIHRTYFIKQVFDLRNTDMPNVIIPLIITVIVFLPFVVLYYLLKYDTYGILSRIGNILLICACIYAIWNIITSIIIPFYKCKKYLSNINYSSLRSREHIYKIYFYLKKSPFHLNKFITTVESNVENVTGIWPSNNFLKANGDHFEIRMAKIDMKWKGLDR